MHMKLFEKATAGKGLSLNECREILRLLEVDPVAVRRAAHELTRKHAGDRVELCAIVNAKSGRCPEACAFCAQSSRHATNAPVYPFIGAAKVVEAAKAAKARGVRRFGIVISGTRPSKSDLEGPQGILAAVAGVAALGMEADASLGIVDAASIRALKDAGLTRLHHNLETARSFFPQICSTHDYEEDVAVVQAALAAGLEVCCGGLFGLGETWEQRLEFALTLRELGVTSVPVNFLTPIPGTPLENRPPLSAGEALNILALMRCMLPKANLRVCGGREAVLGSRKAEALTSGANGFMVGDYLTTKGSSVEGDLADIEELGLQAM
jgi:biotin synthase